MLNETVNINIEISVSGAEHCGHRALRCGCLHLWHLSLCVAAARDGFDPRQRSPQPEPLSVAAACSCRCPRTGAGSGPLKLLFSVAHGIMLRAPTDALQLRGSGAARTGPILLSNEFKYI